MTASSVRCRRCGGIERLPLGVLDGHVEQRQEGRQGRLQGPVQREELAGHLLADLARVVALLDLEVGLEQVDDRQVAGRLAVGDRAGLEDEPALGAVGVGELPDEARLPDAGLADEGDDLAVARRRARPSARRSCSSSASRPTKRVSPRAAAAWSRDRERARPGQLVDLDRAPAAP